MRRGGALFVVILLLLAASAFPLAAAEDGKGGGKGSGKGAEKRTAKDWRKTSEALVPAQPPARAASAHGFDETSLIADHDEDEERDVPAEAAFSPRDLDELAERGETTGILAVGGVVSALLLALALAGTWWARRPTKEKPRKKTFEAGRSRAHEKRPASVREALDAFPAGRVGNLVRAQALLDGYDVTVARKKGSPCHQTAGYLAGLFESAWADAVRIEHPACAGDAGGECRYVVRRGQGTVNDSARPTGAASIPGSAGAPRRSPPARAGGGRG